jgi:hypothetical protein
VGEDRTGRDARQRLTVNQAADALGVTVDAIRSRIKRDTIAHERVGDRVYVLLDADQARPGHDQYTGRPGESSTLISEMRSRIQFLEDELQRKDAILLNMTEAMKALSPPSQEAPPDERESPKTTTDSEHRAPPRPGTEGTQEDVQRPWWRRMFGG